MHYQNGKYGITLVIPLLVDQFYGPISHPSKGKIWISATAENFTKWFEVVFLKKATSEAASQFVQENIFSIPRGIRSDNGTPFVGQLFELMLERYQIFHEKFTRYYPQGNGAIEAFNKTLVAIIRKMIEEKSIRWDDCLPLALWAYRATKHTTTKEKEVSLVVVCLVTL